MAPVRRTRHPARPLSTPSHRVRFVTNLLICNRPILLALAISLCVGAALSPSPGLASGSVRSLPLKQVIAHTDAVALVRFGSPRVRAVRISVTPKGQKPNPKRWPDFVRRDRRLKVLELLWSRGKKPPKGTLSRSRGKKPPKGTLLVAPGDWRFHLQLHRMYHVENRRKIPIYHRYDGHAALGQLNKKAGQAIALLRADKSTGWRMAAAFAFVPVAERERLMAALKSRK